jgi:CMP-N,N'-diacetyllegionaminic acid synthase
MSDTVAIILARGGSKGIPGKNIIDFCGKPLLAWSIIQAIGAEGITSTWVSSDELEILDVAKKYGANLIERPENLSVDTSTSESGWLHALNVLEAKGMSVDLIVGLQATSPLRESSDIDQAIEDFHSQDCDSLLSVAPFNDFLIWEPDTKPGHISTNYDYKNRGRRQDRKERFHENGSIYIFPPDILRNHNNRLGDRVGISIMPMWKSPQIDDYEDLRVCAATMREFMPKMIDGE